MSLRDVLSLGLLSCIGAVEWWLALARQSAHTCGHRGKVAAIVVIEVLLGWFVVAQFVGSDARTTVAVAYALGSGLGAFLAR